MKKTLIEINGVPTVCQYTEGNPPTIYLPHVWSKEIKTIQVIIYGLQNEPFPSIIYKSIEKP